MEKNLNKKIRVAGGCEKLLYILVITLVFEGILRKFIPTLKTPVFFLKDVLCIIGIIQARRVPLPKDMERFRSIWITLIILFIPLLFIVAIKDIFLAVFAAKQYLLYFVIVLITITAFPPEKEKNFKRFLFFCVLLLIPTAIVAMIQNALPGSHWLNRSVGGESLQGFSAAGRLRVGSTFSFTAQYSWFIVAESFLLATSFFLQPNFSNKIINKLLPLIYFVLVIILIISTFITGGRTAVLGCSTNLALGAIFIGIKRPKWFLERGLPILVVGAISLIFLRDLKPEYFVAYDARSSGYAGMSHNEEIEGRVLGGFTDWTEWFWEQNSTSIFFGNGLGIMSNGSAQISEYAARIRYGGFWTEGDVPSTFWEGGLYLGFIWYGFRLSMFLLCFRLWRSIRNQKLASAAAIPLANIIIQGAIATLGLHPPLAIWWWLAVGTLFFLYRLEQYKLAAMKLSDVQVHEKEGVNGHIFMAKDIKVTDKV